MASPKYLQWLETIIDYKFDDPTLLEKALTGPGAEGDKEGTEEEKLQYEGNRPLASLGRSLLSFIIERRAFSEGQLGRGGIREALEPATAGPTHIMRAKDLKIDTNMKLNPRQRGKAESRTLQLTIYAIIGAVWQDCGEYVSIIDKVIEHLFIGTETHLCVDPRQISISDLITPDLLNDNAFEQHSLVVDNSNVSHYPLNTDLTRDGTLLGFDSLTCDRVVGSHRNQMSSTGVGNDGDLAQHGTGPFGNEISIFPPVGDSPTENQSQGETPLTLNYRSSLATKPKRSLCPDSSSSKAVENNLVQGSVKSRPATKKRRLSTSHAESRQSIQLRYYISLEERRCQSFGLTFPWANIDSMIRASHKSLKDSDLLVLKILFFAIGSPESLVALKDILKAHRTALVDQELKGGHDLPLADRIKAIEEVGPNIAYLVLRRRCHIYQLFSEYSAGNRKTSDGFVIDTTQSISRQKSPKIGNPHNLEDSRIAEQIFKEVYPDLKPDTEIYQKKRRFVQYLRKLGERFDMLVRTFGYGILGLLSWPGSELYETPALIVTDELVFSLSDTVFKSFVLYLTQEQGEYLSATSNAVSDIVTTLFRAPLEPLVTFPLEQVEASKILEAPKGRVLLHLISSN